MTEQEKEDNLLPITKQVRDEALTLYRRWERETEPNFAEMVTQDMYHCVIKRNSVLGTLCGYVGVTRDHPWWGKHYFDLDQVEVHGNLTFSDYMNGSGIIDYWYLGFDCAHAGDEIPNLPFGLSFFMKRSGEQCTYKDVNYVTFEIIKLLNQAREAHKECLLALKK